jgi:hypothetical protein
VHGHAGRLVDGDDVVVFIKDVERNGFRFGTQRRTRLHLDLNAVSGAEALGTLGHTGIYEHEPGVNEFLDPGAADVAETSGDSVIEALARIVFVGDEFMKMGIVALVHAEIVTVR